MSTEGRECSLDPGGAGPSLTPEQQQLLSCVNTVAAAMPWTPQLLAIPPPSTNSKVVEICLLIAALKNLGGTQILKQVTPHSEDQLQMTMVFF